MRKTLTLLGLGMLLGVSMYGQQVPPEAKDKSSHTVQFVTVAPDVKLEVLDWGGSGKPLLLLAGLGDDAHVFDTFSPKLAGTYHVYGVTRRGFGASSRPPVNDGNYAADRLGDDVLAVMEALKLNRPVLAGHSVAGEEMSSVGSRYPDKVAGLVYLDAGYAYAFYNADRGDAVIDRNYLRKQLDAFMRLMSLKERKAQLKEMLEQSMPRFEKDLQELQKQLASAPDSMFVPPLTPQMSIMSAVQGGAQKFGRVNCPVLAIYAVAQDFGPAPKEHSENYEAKKTAAIERSTTQANAFALGNPQARVVSLANADHYVFRSNEEDVLREMTAFIATLPK